MQSYRSFIETRQLLDKRSVSMLDVLESYKSAIKKNQNLNAFTETFLGEAEARSQLIQQKIEDGTAGKLAGMFIGIKDNICYEGHKVSASSKILENYTSPYSSTIIKRLLAEDAIIIGRCNCDEFAMGSTNENSFYGPVRNFADSDRFPGGSSGGSAVAVQAGMCTAAIGTDTGGSIRQPAALCGVFGFKPTYGRISRYGIIAYASSFDQVGTLTNTIEDAALLYEIMAGRDGYDSTLSSQSIAPSNFSSSAEKKRIAYFPEIINSDALDSEIKKMLAESISVLKKEGHIVEPVSFPYMDYMVATYYILTMAEVSTNLARYDGVHYGYRSPNAVNLETTYKKSRSEGFGAEVKRRIMLGTFVLSEGFYDAYYGKAQKVRRLVQERTREILSDYDFILLPTTPEPAGLIGYQSEDPVKNYLADIFTVQATLAGVPGISIPAGNNANGLPLGIQLLANSFQEKELLEFSKLLSEMLVK